MITWWAMEVTGPQGPVTSAAEALQAANRVWGIVAGIEPEDPEGGVWLVALNQHQHDTIDPAVSRDYTDGRYHVNPVPER